MKIAPTLPTVSTAPTVTTPSPAPTNLLNQSDFKQLATEAKSQLVLGEKLINDLQQLSQPNSTLADLPQGLSNELIKFNASCQTMHNLLIQGLLQHPHFSINQINPTKAMLYDSRLGNISLRLNLDTLVQDLATKYSLSVHKMKPQDVLNLLTSVTTLKSSATVGSQQDHKRHLPTIPMILEEVLFLLARSLMVMDVANSILAIAKRFPQQMNNI